MTNHESNNMTHDEFEAALPDLLDGSLDPAARGHMEAHGLDCAECAALMADLTKIRADAGKLPLLSPSHDLWSGISGIESRIAAPVVQLPVAAEHQQGDAVVGLTARAVYAPMYRKIMRAGQWRLAAAATILVVLMAATAGVTWQVALRNAMLAEAQPTDSGFAAAMASTRNTKYTGNTRNTGNARNASHPALNETYDGEIATLRTLVDGRRSELDSATVAILEKNLKVIDDAIAESKAALAKSPANAFLLDRLTDAYDSKLRTLRAVAAMPQRG
jgi:hypothetical protein